MAAWVYTACGRDPGYLIGGAPREPAGELPRRRRRPLHHRGGRVQRRLLRPRPEVPPLPARDAAADQRRVRPRRPLPDARRRSGTPTRGCSRCSPRTASWSPAATPPRCASWPPAPAAAACSTAWSRATTCIRSARSRRCPRRAGSASTTRRRARSRSPCRSPAATTSSNALAVWAAARRDGIPAAERRRRLRPLPAASSGAWRSSAPRRGVTVVDDFAHHPTAVEKTLVALRQRYPGRRLVALFEPRSLTAGRGFFFEPYRQAFAGADRVLFAPTFHNGRLAAEERLDFGVLAAELTRRRRAGRPLRRAPTGCCGRPWTRRATASVLVTMSSGSFEGMPHRLIGGAPGGLSSGRSSEDLRRPGKPAKLSGPPRPPRGPPPRAPGRPPRSR